MDKLRSLRINEENLQRRASHSGFDSARVIDPDLLRRRQSLPATNQKKIDTSRKLHSSSACINIIKDFHEVKLVKSNKKDQKSKSLHPDLQALLERVAPHKINEITYEENDEDEKVTRSASFEGLKTNDEIKEEIKRSTSETAMDGISMKQADNVDDSDDADDAV